MKSGSALGEDTLAWERQGRAHRHKAPQVGLLRALQQAGAGGVQDEARIQCPAVRGGSRGEPALEPQRKAPSEPAVRGRQTRR